jgi:nucleoside-diphosphate-sugar epimerase
VQVPPAAAEPEDIMTTLVIGARGRVGRHVVDQLLAAGESVRASVRNAATADWPAGCPSSRPT